MTIARVMKQTNKLPITNRFDGVCFGVHQNEEDNLYLIVRCKLKDGLYKYKASPILNKYTKFNSEKYYTKNEILDRFFVVSMTRPDEIKKYLNDRFIGA